tara:strand:+ start:92 stop:313 length:222 start_codon:yes stop_codon:yes gene_type:complete
MTRTLTDLALELINKKDLKKQTKKVLKNLTKLMELTSFENSDQKSCEIISNSTPEGLRKLVQDFESIIHKLKK